MLSVDEISPFYNTIYISGCIKSHLRLPRSDQSHLLLPELPRLARVLRGQHCRVDGTLPKPPRVRQQAVAHRRRRGTWNSGRT